MQNSDDRFQFCKDVNKDLRSNCKFIVCQLESLTTVSDNFDCVIFDESESNFMQFDSHVAEIRTILKFVSLERRCGQSVESTQHVSRRL